MSIKCFAYSRCAGRNKEKLAWRAKFKIFPKLGSEIFFTGILSPASSPKRLNSWVPIDCLLKIIKTIEAKLKVFVTGLPPSGSWQDLKDHMREAGDVCFADSFKDGSGVVEFLRYEDMKYAIKKLDDSRFRSHEGEVSYIRVKEDRGGSDRRSGGHSRSRSYSPRRRGSPTYSPVKRSYSRSRSRS
ncbi:hypothetical protein FQR65_LT15032 [Abscondita terminalis]|nr:hypothetical protein FQR65_LT15032 [Abscondita terminalis]